MSNTTPHPLLDGCRTLLLDMDGTLLDLRFDNFMWLTRVPERFAEVGDLQRDEARARLFALYREFRGTLEWYCLDHWSERLGLDVLDLHRQHRDMIAYLPGARSFLQIVAASSVRVLLVTNSHRDTLHLKAEVTGLEAYLDGMYSSHDMGYPKEDRRFWQALGAVESIDPATTVFIDDTVSVLRGASSYGLGRLLQVTQPDSSQRPTSGGEFTEIESVGTLSVGDLWPGADATR